MTKIPHVKKKKGLDASAVAVEIQRIINDGPKPYADVKFTLAKDLKISDSEAASWIRHLATGRYFKVFGITISTGSVIFLPWHRAEASTMYRSVLRDSVGWDVIWAAKKKHAKMVKTTEKYLAKHKGDHTSTEISASTGIEKSVVMRALGEIRGEA